MHLGQVWLTDPGSNQCVIFAKRVEILCCKIQIAGSDVKASFALTRGFLWGQQ